MSRIGFLITRMAIGGSERIFVNLAKRLDKEKFRVIVICLYDPGHLEKEIMGQDIKIYSQLMHNKIDFRGCFHLFRIFRKERIELLYILGQYLSQVVGVFVGRLSGVKRIIIGYHSQNPDQTLGFKELVQRLSMPLVDRAVCLSNNHKNFIARFKRIPLKKIEVIPNGIVINGSKARVGCALKLKELGLNGKVRIIGMVANLRREKGHVFFLEAAKEILKRGFNTKFLIIGDGPLKDSLKFKVKSLKLEENVLFLGLRKDLDELLPLFDVAVLSSITECSPLAVLEYMANSRPIVATGVGNVPELIVDGETGFLVPPQDPSRLAEKVSILLQDPRLCSSFGEAAKKRAIKYFSIEKMIKRYEGLFLGMLKKN